MSRKLIDGIINSSIKVNWKGSYVWVAMEIAEYLEYDRPSKVVNYFLTESKLVEGKDYIIISQNDLREFKDILASMGISKFRQSPKLVLFYESGLVEFLSYRNKITIEEIRYIFEKQEEESLNIEKGVSVKFFEDYEINTLVYNGKQCWIAVDIAEVLGYSDRGRAVVQCILREDLKEGLDYDVLLSEEIKVILKQIGNTPMRSRKAINKLTILYKRGLLGFINYAHMPIGKVFREWLRDEVFEELIDMEVGDIISEGKFSVKRDNLSNNDLDNSKVHNSKFEIMDVLNVVDKILDEKDEMKLFCLNTIFKNI
ncbi:MAG: BRO family protein [Sarcina sp.]